MSFTKSLLAASFAAIGTNAISLDINTHSQQQLAENVSSNTNGHSHVLA